MPIDYLDDLKREMERQGFRWQELRGDPYEPGLFYRRATTKRPCKCNDKDQLVFHVF